MYKLIIRPVLFLINPETVHHLVVGLLRVGFMIPGISYLVRKSFTFSDPKLETKLFGLTFPNKVGLAAGFDKQANIYNHMAAFGFGHIEIGTVNPLPQPGNPKPRLFRIRKDNALINRMGFNNPGVDVFVENLKKTKPNVIIGGNIGKNTATPNTKATDDYIICFEKLHPWVDYFVVNVSCPNIEGLKKLQDKDELVNLLNRISAANSYKEKRKPILLKISPDLNETQLDEVLEIAEITGIDGIIATNTTTGRDGLSISHEEIEKIGRGGLSGKPLNKISTNIIRYLNEKSGGKLPIIAVGGIMSTQDAIEKIKAGASLVQIYTGFIYEGPSIVKRINKALVKNT
jgi:dihydroorotate dehydrogenase